MDGNKQFSAFIAAADLCEFFSTVFRFPSVEVMDGFVLGSVLADLQSCLQDLDAPKETLTTVEEILKKYRKSDPSCLLVEAKKSYSLLYDMPGKLTRVHIFEGPFCYVHEGGTGSPSNFLSSATLDVEEMMREAGVLPRLNTSRPVDSVYDEFDFLRYLYVNAANALRSHNEEASLLCQNRINSFQGKHCARWIPEFMKASQREAGAGLYADIALIAGRCFSLLP